MRAGGTAGEDDATPGGTPAHGPGDGTAAGGDAPSGASRTGREAEGTGAPRGAGGDGAGPAGEGAQAGDGAQSAGSRRAGGAGAGGKGGAEREFLALERELAVFLRRARAQSGEMAREVHPELESSAYGLFVRLDDAGPQRATELSAYFGVGKATLSRQLRALEQLGLVARDPDPADGRASLVRLTDEGRARFRHVRDARRERYVRKLADWDRAEVAELARLLHHFNQRSEG